MDLSISQFQLFFLVFTRIATMTMLMPVFGYRGIPNQTKIGLALLLTVLLFPIVLPTLPGQDSKAAMPLSVISFALLVGKEVLAGLLLGFATILLFIGVQMSGRIVDTQMGFRIANVIDPQSRTRVSVIGQFEYLLAMLIFLSIDGHHFLLRALEKSFEFIPPGGAQFSNPLTAKMVALTGGLFEIAVQIGAPVIAALLITSVVLGLIARTVPQMNVFIVGLPLKIGVGLLAVTLSLPLFLSLFKTLFAQFQRDILTLIRLLWIQDERILHTVITWAFSSAVILNGVLHYVQDKLRGVKNLLASYSDLRFFAELALSVVEGLRMTPKKRKARVEDK